VNPSPPQLVIPDLIRDPCSKTTTVLAELVEAVFASCAGGLPTSRGLPGGNSLSFASPKESKQRKGDPMVWVPCATLRGNLRCSPKVGSSSNSAAPQTIARPDPLSAVLLGPARRVEEPGSGTGMQSGSGEDALRASSPPRIRIRLPRPLGWAEERRSKRTRARDCLSRRRVRARPRFDRAPQVARSEAKGPRLSGRLSFGYFSLATQRKVPRPPGRDPACRQSADLRVKDDSRPPAGRKK